MRAIRMWVALPLLLAACGGSADVRIGTASSLVDVTGEMAIAAGVDAEIIAAGTPTLLAQQREGAGFDLLLTADRSAFVGLDGSPPVRVATNRLVVAMPTGNPGGVSGVADLGRRGLIVGLGAEGVPVGDYARSALSEAGVTPLPDTLEPSARALVTKVERGELDVAVVYQTDVRGRNMEWIPIESTVIPEYWLIQFSQEAKALVEFIVSDEGRSLLQEYGFGASG